MDLLTAIRARCTGLISGTIGDGTAVSAAVGAGILHNRGGKLVKYYDLDRHTREHRKFNVNHALFLFYNLYLINVANSRCF